MTTHKIILKPAPRGTATFWLQRSDHTLYLGESREPLFAAARALLEHNLAQPTDHLQAQWDGDEHWSMRSPVGVAAGLTVVERSDGRSFGFQRHVPLADRRLPTNRNPQIDEAT